MKPEIVIADFLRYNASALNEMKNESPEIATAFAQVIKELALKYGNIATNVPGAEPVKKNFTKFDYLTLTGKIFEVQYEGEKTSSMRFVSKVIFKDAFIAGEFDVYIQFI